jgi:hypothetical protein
MFENFVGVAASAAAARHFIEVFAAHGSLRLEPPAWNMANSLSGSYLGTSGFGGHLPVMEQANAQSPCMFR